MKAVINKGSCTDPVDMTSLSPVLSVLIMTSLWPLMTSSQSQEEGERLSRLERSVEMLTRQLMMLQLSQEEARRSDGDSGLKQIRFARDGTRPYFTNTHTGSSVAAMHDHADMPRTCGLGEFEAVLNGVHFRTRHNDYLLRMPASTRVYHATHDVPFPPVPPSVSDKTSVEEQIVEMREWFKAWKDGNITERDYRPYFRPLLCYLEGAWTTDSTLQEPFQSRRHRIEAVDWTDLQDKIRYTSYTGDKHKDENYAFLPTLLLNDTGVPTLAHWNYRVLCHPISSDLSPSDLQPVDDLAARLASKATMEEFVRTRAARFTLNTLKQDRSFRWSLLDKIMSQIPGNNNYGARLLDRVLGDVKLNANNKRALNTGYYHRWYKLSAAGAMGERVFHVGFSDRNLFVAETTQPRVAPMSITTCRAAARESKSCTRAWRRVTYAVPLELVFLTPLNSWNPYNLHFKDENLSRLGRTVTAGGRDGKLIVQRAYNGTNNRYFYQTPAEFFSGGEVNPDPADTVKGAVGVLDRKGSVKAVVASGVRIMLPEIKGVGVLRTRYPIMPVHAEGSSVWKELEALKDIVLNNQHQKYMHRPADLLQRQTHQDILSRATTETVKRHRNNTIKYPVENYTVPKTEDVYFVSRRPEVSLQDMQDIVSNVELPNLVNDINICHIPLEENVVLVTSLSTRSYLMRHRHIITLNHTQANDAVNAGKPIVVRTTLDSSHSHLMILGFNQKTQYFYIASCDSKQKCWDGHSMDLERVAFTSLAFPFGHG